MILGFKYNPKTTVIDLVVPTKVIKVLRLFIDKANKTNCGLNVINLEIINNECLFVATNEHILGCFHFKINNPNKIKISVSMPEYFFDHVVSSGDKDFFLSIHQQKKIIEARLNLTTTTVMNFNNINYPDWKNAIKKYIKTTTNVVTLYHPYYLNLLCKVSKMLSLNKNQEYLNIIHNGNHPALVDVGSDYFFAYLSPLLSEGVRPPCKLPAVIL